MTGRLCVVFCAMCSFASFASSDLALGAGTFDAGVEDWTASGGTLAYVAAGGNPGGFLQLTDTTTTDMFLIAPKNELYSGDLSEYVNGFVQFDARLVGLSGAATPYPSFGRITFSSGRTSASFDLAPLGEPTDEWKTYVARLTSPPWGTSFDAWRAILSNVTFLTVNLESRSPIVETVGFDNFRLSSLPEPGTLTLALIVAVGAALSRRNRNPNFAPWEIAGNRPIRSLQNELRHGMKLVAISRDRKNV